MMLFIFATKEQRDSLKPTSDELTGMLASHPPSSGSCNKRGH